MFETQTGLNLSNKQPIHILGTTLWNQVHMPFIKPWFHVEYESTLCNGKDKDKSVVFLSAAEQISEFIGLGGITVLRIIIASPGYMNGTGQWQFELLKEIWRVDINEGMHYFSYHLQNGATYNDCPINDTEELRRTLIANFN